MSLIEKAVSSSTSGTTVSGPTSDCADPQMFDLDYKMLGELGLYNPEARNTRLGQEMRAIRRRLLRRLGFEQNGQTFQRGRRRRNLIMTTSAHAGEGGTFTALNLALSLALEDGIETLLVEVSTQSPRAVESFTLLEGPGLAEWLAASPAEPSKNIDALFHRARQAPFSILPAGGPVIEPPADKNLGASLAAAAPDSVIIIDAPPVLAAESAVRLAQYVDETLIVVASEKTQKSTLVAAIDELVDTNPNISLILNRRLIGAEGLEFDSYRHNRYNRAAQGSPHNLRQGGAFQ